MADKALIVIDLQNDFCPGGALAVAGGDEIVPLVNDTGAGFRACDPDAGLAPAAPFELRLEPSRQEPVRDDRDALWPADAVAGPLHPGVGRGGVPPAFQPHQGRTHHPQGVPHGDRQLFGLLRERPQDADRACRLSARARHLHRSRLSGWRRISASPIRRSTRCREGFATTVRLDACRGIDLGGSMEAMLGKMKAAGVRLA